jgi:hypothetical protein
MCNVKLYLFQQNTLVNDGNTCVIMMKNVRCCLPPTEQNAVSCELAELLYSQSFLPFWMTESQVLHLKGKENMFYVSNQRDAVLSSLFYCTAKSIYMFRVSFATISYSCPNYGYFFNGFYFCVTDIHDLHQSS